MKNSSILVLFFFIISIQAKSQTSDLEVRVIDSLLRNKSYYGMDTSIKYCINENISIAPMAKYFSERHLWHVRGILKADCYSKNDSLSNKQFEKQIIRYKSTDLSLISLPEKEILKCRLPEISVLRRFYYCDKIYVVVYIKNTNDLINRQILFAFENDGTFHSSNSMAYVN